MLARSAPTEFLCAGWVEYREPTIQVPQDEPDSYPEGIFGRAVFSVLAPCVADPTHISLIALTSGDLGPVLPYLNAEMERASFNRRVPVLTFMDEHRMVALHSRRITVAKADEVVDGWRTLESVRCLVESVWARRQEIEPSYETRERPPALEIFKRLPRRTARSAESQVAWPSLKVWSGEASVIECTPVFADKGVRAELRGALEEVCAALGV